MQRPYVFLADFLYAIECLRIRDSVTARVVMRMLSLEELEATTAVTKEGAYAARAATMHASEPPVSIPEPAEPAVLHAPEQSYARAPVFRKLATTASSPQPPSWFEDVTPMPRPVGHTPLATSVAPLFPQQQTRSLLAAALASSDAEGPLDIPRIIEELAQLRPIRELPRETSPTLRPGVRILVDAGLGMAPFRFDIDRLLQSIALLLPPVRMPIHRFTGSPLRYVADTVGVRKPWSPWEGTGPFFVISDLGIGTPPLSDERADVTEWLEFADTAHRAGRRVVALVPYGPKRWPRSLSRAICLIHWDRRTSAAAVHRSVLKTKRAIR